LSYYFSTYSHKLLGYFHKIFYRGKTKTIPANISDLLSPLALAVWYMDDGSTKSKRHKGVFLNTQAFSNKDLYLTRGALLKRFHISSTLRKEKNGYQIYLGSSSGESFIKIIKPFLLPSMLYKIPKVLINIMPKK